ncbi:MAG: hypothetical protein R3B81_03255 [bacterium]
MTFLLLSTTWLLWHVLVAGRDVSLLDFTAAGWIAASAFGWRNGVRGLEFLVTLAAGTLAAHVLDWLLESPAIPRPPLGDRLVWVAALGAAWLAAAAVRLRRVPLPAPAAAAAPRNARIASLAREVLDRQDSLRRFSADTPPSAPSAKEPAPPRRGDDHGVPDRVWRRRAFGEPAAPPAAPPRPPVAPPVAPPAPLPFARRRRRSER